MDCSVWPQLQFQSKLHYTQSVLHWTHWCFKEFWSIQLNEDFIGMDCSAVSVWPQHLLVNTTLHYTQSVMHWTQQFYKQFWSWQQQRPYRNGLLSVINLTSTSSTIHSTAFHTTCSALHKTHSHSHASYNRFTECQKRSFFQGHASANAHLTFLKWI